MSGNSVRDVFGGQGLFGNPIKDLPTFLDLWRKTMRLTSKGRYAVRAMLDLTFHSNGNPVRLQEISTRQSISLHYLEQLFRKLRTGKVVKSVRGPGGGYVLSRSMDEITVKDVLDCVGENINPARDILNVPSSGIEIMKDEQGNDINAIVDTREFNLTKTYFENLGQIMMDYLATTSLGDLSRKTAGAGESAEATGSSNADSSIRANIGEMNQ
jgi:Rrf2 family iron-sulfur cluster assembly transcriptional regulator